VRAAAPRHPARRESVVAQWLAASSRRRTCSKPATPASRSRHDAALSSSSAARFAWPTGSRCDRASRRRAGSSALPSPHAPRRAVRRRRDERDRIRSSERARSARLQLAGHRATGPLARWAGVAGDRSWSSPSVWRMALTVVVAITPWRRRPEGAPPTRPAATGPTAAADDPAASFRFCLEKRSPSACDLQRYVALFLYRSLAPAPTRSPMTPITSSHWAIRPMAVTSGASTHNQSIPHRLTRPQGAPAEFDRLPIQCAHKAHIGLTEGVSFAPQGSQLISKAVQSLGSDFACLRQVTPIGTSNERSDGCLGTHGHAVRSSDAR
jgi:hypothetical protein